MDINLIIRTDEATMFNNQTDAVKKWINDEDHNVDAKYNVDDNGTIIFGNNEKNQFFDAFLKGTGIASTGQGRFTNNSKDKVKNKWNEVLPILKELISLNDNKTDENENSHDAIFDACKKVQEKLTSLCGKDRKPWAAIHAMIVALRPNFFCSIVSENNLDALYKELENIHASSDENEEIQQNTNDIICEKTICFNGGEAWKKLQSDWRNAKEEKNNMSWFFKSHATKVYFDSIGSSDQSYKTNNSEYPWATLVALRGEAKINDLVERLVIQKNIIFTGAPGTGKTYLARKIAAKMTGLNLTELQTSNQYGFVQFHPSYDYTDFVEGLRPDKGKAKNNTQIVFKRKDGIFKAFCEKAAQAEIEDKEKDNDKKRKFVFVIDEINRGEISKIFGELFFSIDPGYRGEKDKDEVSNKINTQYQNLVYYGLFQSGFYVPDNVYVIGTMNDIDRSVESMDFAFRRRFAFYEISAEDSEGMIFAANDWGKHEDKKQIAVDRMSALNKAIVDKGGLTAQYQIGGSYFLKLKDVGFNFNRLWNEYLRGTLYEYFRGLPNKEIEEKMNLLKSAYDNGDDE